MHCKPLTKSLYKEAAALSNEELAVLIQAGKIDYLEELWSQVERLVKWKANRVMTALDGRGGVEFGDLYSSGYIAMVEAVESYRPENGVFSAWFMYYLKTAFAEVTGYRTKTGREERLDHAVSLDKTVGDESDGAIFGDLVPDPKAAATLEGVEEAIYQQQLHAAMETVLRELPETQISVIRHRYYMKQSLAQAGRALGMDAEQVRKLEMQGIRELRGHRLAKKIRPFYDFNFYGGTGLAVFRSSGMSVQERYLIHAEQGKGK